MPLFHASFVERSPSLRLSFFVGLPNISRPTHKRNSSSDQVKMDGTLEVHVEDSVAGSRVHYDLVANGRRRRLQFTGAGPQLQSGSRVRVRGVPKGDALCCVESNANGLVVEAAALTDTSNAQRTAVILRELHRQGAAALHDRVCAAGRPRRHEQLGSRELPRPDVTRGQRVRLVHDPNGQHDVPRSADEGIRLARQDRRDQRRHHL